MAVGNLVDRYKRYKSGGTAKLVTWLTENARQCKDVTDMLPGLRDAKNAVKQAKKGRGSSSSSGTKVTLTTAKLIGLAEVVAHSTRPIPEEVIVVIKEVIEGRQTCASWNGSIDEDPESLVGEQNKSHQHFIDVLRQILAILQTARIARSTPARRSKQGPAAKKSPLYTNVNLTNAFACLTIEEPFSADTNHTTATNTLRQPPKMTFELEDDGEEKAFAIWCLLQDFHELRLQVRRTWEDYAAGKISFSTASVVTDVAISIARCTHVNFVQQFLDLSLFPKIMDILQFGIKMVMNRIVLYPRADGACRRSHKRHSKDDITELLCLRSFVVLNQYTKTLIMKNTTGKLELGNQARLNFAVHPFGTVLLNKLEDLHTIAQVSMDGGAFYDQILLTVMSLHDKIPAITTSVVVTCQLYMDIYDVLGQGRTAGIRNLKSLIDHDQEAVSQYSGRYGGPIKCGCGDANKNANCDHFGESMGDWEDPFHLHDHLRKVDVVEHKRVTQSMHEAFPVTSGVLLNRAMYNMHGRGIKLCNSGALVLSVAFLYRAASLAGVLTSPWPDMDFVIAAHSKKYPFVLESEHSVPAMAKYFAMALGAKHTQYLSDRRPALPPPNVIEKEGRMIETDFPLMSAYASITPEDYDIH